MNEPNYLFTYAVSLDYSNNEYYSMLIVYICIHIFFSSLHVGSSLYPRTLAPWCLLLFFFQLGNRDSIFRIIFIHAIVIVMAEAGKKIKLNTFYWEKESQARIRMKYDGIVQAMGDESRKKNGGIRLDVESNRWTATSARTWTIVFQARMHRIPWIGK